MVVVAAERATEAVTVATAVTAATAGVTAGLLPIHGRAQHSRHHTAQRPQHRSA